MSTTAAVAHNADMNHHQLLALAIQLTYDTFPEPSDEHIIAVFHRLAWNWRYGMGTAGAVTLH